MKKLILGILVCICSLFGDIADDFFRLERDFEKGKFEEDDSYFFKDMRAVKNLGGSVAYCMNLMRGYETREERENGVCMDMLREDFTNIGATINYVDEMIANGSYNHEIILRVYNYYRPIAIELIEEFKKF